MKQKKAHAFIRNRSLWDKTEAERDKLKELKAEHKRGKNPVRYKIGDNRLVYNYKTLPEKRRMLGGKKRYRKYLRSLLDV